ncbi:MAG: hypothetical protein QM323_02020, partial [Acidobacteriota bacterium]|nr:hypothetical protein [Acidobacteriota bacterium]
MFFCDGLVSHRFLDDLRLLDDRRLGQRFHDGRLSRCRSLRCGLPGLFEHLDFLGDDLGRRDLVDDFLLSGLLR